ncbi:MAG TPA: RAD55 family ATPase [Candidatus Thermoplasmatota archaeon]|nr:RAD55 family ATPase [Candidatus Thermoplasmatota archaeon]
MDPPAQKPRVSPMRPAGAPAGGSLQRPPPQAAPRAVAAAPSRPAAPSSADPENAPAAPAKASPGASLATTGIAGLDAQLGGGIPRGTTLLLIGEPGNAVPLFSQQFAGGGLDAGEDVLYFEFDRPAGGVRATVQSFVQRGNEGKAELSVHDGYSPQFGMSVNARIRDPKAMPVPMGSALEAMMASLQNTSAQRPYRMVAESLSSLTRDDNEREVLKFVRNLVYLGHEMDGLHLISIVKGLHSANFETQLRHLAGGVIEFGAERKGFGIYNYLVVSKLLNVQDPVRILLWKETEKGLWLESTKRVF